MRLYKAECNGNAQNCSYPHECVVTDEASFKDAIDKDHVMAKYKNDYRSNDNFLKSDCLPFDCDNDHSDKSQDWVEPLEIAIAFPGVCFFVAYSKSHMLQKGNRSPRPRFHVYFPLDEIIASKDEYVALKQAVSDSFIYFDKNALDAARFLYGYKGDFEYFQGDTGIDRFIADADFEQWEQSTKEIAHGGRNNTMSRIAGRLIKRYGCCDEASEKFFEQAERCNPPLSDSELDSIWRSAVRFGRKVAAQPGYIAPEDYGIQYKPGEFTDVDQACVLAAEYSDVLAYSPVTDYIVYNGSFWEESKEKAQGFSQELTDKQLKSAKAEMFSAKEEMLVNGAALIIEQLGEKKAQECFSDIQAKSYARYQNALAFKKYVLKRRSSKDISNCLKEARPKVSIAYSTFDTSEFLLNTPSYTVDLKTGLAQDHYSKDYFTKQTSVDLGDENADMWQEALNTIFESDKELIDYVQRIVGLAAIGKVYVEALIISYGDGSNGKSTFWNAIARVLGTYSGVMSAEALTVGYKQNIKHEVAEAKGKRLLIAAEMEESVRLSTSNVKKLCSTDRVGAEKKFKAPFHYTPSHTLVLYTNHLPRVGAMDSGTWRRLIVIPFNAKIQGTKKNYSDTLCDMSGGAILQWIVDGARMIIAEGYQLTLPKKVQDSISRYKGDNDWFSRFIEECCEIDLPYTEKSGELYSAYRSHCLSLGEFTRSTADFYHVLELQGFHRKRYKAGVLVIGLRLKSEFI